MTPTLNLLSWLDEMEAAGLGVEPADLETFVAEHLRCGSELTAAEFDEYGDLLVSEWLGLCLAREADLEADADELRKQMQVGRGGDQASDDESV